MQTAAEKLGASGSVVLDWFRRGLLPGRQQRRGAAVWIRLDEAVFYRVSGQAPRHLPWQNDTIPEMIPLSQAPAHFSLSKAELTLALKAGRFLAWRLVHGGQYRWYLQEKACPERGRTGDEPAHPADLLSKSPVFLSENNPESA